MIPQQQALPRTAPSGLVAPRVVGRHGNTGKGRLDLLDALLQMYEPELFSIDTSVGVEQDTQRAQSFDVCVDVGFGDSVHTFVDFARNLHARRMMGTLLVIGTESNSKRLASGKANLKDLFDGSMQKADSVELRLGEVKGWFALPLHGTEPAPAFIRALNVLRDYHPSDALHALHTLGAQLKYGGLLMEGSASTHGHTAVVALVRRGAKGACAEATRGQVEDVATQLRLEALCFCVDFRGDGPRLKGCPNRWFSRQIPQLWQHQRTKFGRSTNTKGQEPVPKKRKHGGKRGQKWHGGGGPVSDFLAEWAAVCNAQEANFQAMTQRERSCIDSSPRTRWEQSVRALALHIEGIDRSDVSLKQGFLIWRLPERRSKAALVIA